MSATCLRPPASSSSNVTAADAACATPPDARSDKSRVTDPTRTPSACAVTPAGRDHLRLVGITATLEQKRRSVPCSAGLPTASMPPRRPEPATRPTWRCSATALPRARLEASKLGNYLVPLPHPRQPSTRSGCQNVPKVPAVVRACKERGRRPAGSLDWPILGYTAGTRCAPGRWRGPRLRQRRLDDHLSFGRTRAPLGP